MGFWSHHSAGCNEVRRVASSGRLRSIHPHNITWDKRNAELKTRTFLVRIFSAGWRAQFVSPSMKEQTCSNSKLWLHYRSLWNCHAQPCVIYGRYDILSKDCEFGQHITHLPCTQSIMRKSSVNTATVFPPNNSKFWLQNVQYTNGKKVVLGLSCIPIAYVCSQQPQYQPEMKLLDLQLQNEVFLISKLEHHGASRRTNTKTVTNSHCSWGTSKWILSL